MKPTKTIFLFLCLFFFSFTSKAELMYIPATKVKLSDQVGCNSYSSGGGCSNSSLTLPPECNRNDPRIGYWSQGYGKTFACGIVCPPNTRSNSFYDPTFCSRDCPIGESINKITGSCEKPCQPEDGLKAWFNTGWYSNGVCHKQGENTVCDRSPGEPVLSDTTCVNSCIYERRPTQLDPETYSVKCFPDEEGDDCKYGTPFKIELNASRTSQSCVTDETNPDPPAKDSESHKCSLNGGTPKTENGITTCEGGSTEPSKDLEKYCAMPGNFESPICKGVGSNMMCGINPSHPSCKGNEWCQKHPDDYACVGKSIFCEQNPNDEKCLEPGEPSQFCKDNPDHLSCKSGGNEFCRTNPDHPSCVPGGNTEGEPSQFCKVNPNHESCRNGGSEFCKANPNHDSCKGGGGGGDGNGKCEPGDLKCTQLGEILENSDTDDNFLNYFWGCRRLGLNFCPFSEGF